MFSVYTVVTYLKNEMNRGDFFMTLRNQPVALSLYRQVLFITFFMITLLLLLLLSVCRQGLRETDWNTSQT